MLTRRCIVCPCIHLWDVSELLARATLHNGFVRLGTPHIRACTPRCCPLSPHALTGVLGLADLERGCACKSSLGLQLESSLAVCLQGMPAHLKSSERLVGTAAKVKLVCAFEVRSGAAAEAKLVCAPAGPAAEAGGAASEPRPHRATDVKHLWSAVINSHKGAHEGPIVGAADVMGQRLGDSWGSLGRAVGLSHVMACLALVEV